MKVILAVMYFTWAVVKIRPEKKFRPVRDFFYLSVYFLFFEFLFIYYFFKFLKFFKFFIFYLILFFLFIYFYFYFFVFFSIFNFLIFYYFFFQALFSLLLEQCTLLRGSLSFTSLSTVQIYDFYIFLATDKIIQNNVNRGIWRNCQTLSPVFDITFPSKLKLRCRSGERRFWRSTPFKEDFQPHATALIDEFNGQIYIDLIDKISKKRQVLDSNRGGSVKKNDRDLKMENRTWREVLGIKQRKYCSAGLSS